MFEKAIEKISGFTRPIHTISRTYGGLILPGTATYFFVNDKGVALTCKHVAGIIPSAISINESYQKFRAERNKIPADGKYSRNLKGLELKYKYQKETTVQLKYNFLNSFDKVEQITTHLHPTLDLAILEFKGFTQKYYTSHATFLQEDMPIKQGKYLCRLGFPFPEFSNFRHDPEKDDIEWTNTGNPNSPSFPLDGIVTRFLGDLSGNINGIELSTPGLRGQSGGPLFDTDGHIVGMQFATSHLHLGFDMKDHEIIADGKKTKISNSPFLHVGLCVHVNKIREFLTEHKIEFNTSGGVE